MGKIREFWNRPMTRAEFRPYRLMMAAAMYLIGALIGTGIFFLLLAVVTHAEDGMTKIDVLRKVWLQTGLDPNDSSGTEAIRSGMDFIQSAALYPVCIDTQRIDLTADTELYDLPSDFYELIELYMSADGRGLEVISVKDKQEQSDQTGTSSEDLHKFFYFVDNSFKQLGFDPIPSATDSVQLIYEVSATKVSFGADSNSQEIQIREPYHPALVAAVKAYVWENHDINKSQNWLDKSTWLINVAERKLSTPPVDRQLVPKAETRH